MSIRQIHSDRLRSGPGPASCEGFKVSKASKASKASTISVTCVETRATHLVRAAQAAVQSAKMVRAEGIYWFSDAAFPVFTRSVDVVHVKVADAFEDFFAATNAIYLNLVPRVVTTDFNLLVQADGFAVNPEAWDDAFLDHDYVGAVWPWMWGGGPHWAGPVVGNGGFSLRSRALYDALLRLDVRGETEDMLRDGRIARREFHALDAEGNKRIPEDILITQWLRETLEREHGIRFCHPTLANKFSVETVSAFTDYWLGKSFGFHGVAAAPHYGVEL